MMPSPGLFYLAFQLSACHPGYKLRLNFIHLVQVIVSAKANAENNHGMDGSKLAIGDFSTICTAYFTFLFACPFSIRGDMPYSLQN